MEADAVEDIEFLVASGSSQKAPLDASREEARSNESGAEDLGTDGEDADMEMPLGQLEVLDPVDHNLRERTQKYAAGWRRKLRHHSRQVPGPARDLAFGVGNLVPMPNPDMWQDAPHLPFDELKSSEAQNRLSACRPISGMREAGVVGGVPTYAHNTGEVNMRRRATLQVASTLGFVLNERGGKFMGITAAETEAVHEIITWFRIPGHNGVLRIYGTLHEKLQGALGKFKAAVQSIIPEGHPRARVRLDKRYARQPREAELGSTLERERTGLVVIDQSGQPMNYQGLDTLTAAVATQDVIISADVPGPSGKGWQRSPGSVALEDLPELNQEWRENLVNGAQVLMEETYVPANDPHYDAKVWPCVHPYGTGSLLAEPGSGGTQAFARNRLTQPQSWFRRSALWGFWMLDRLHKTALFFKKKRMSNTGQNEDGADQDPYHKHFGTAQPANIPESTEWWKRQTRDLFAMSDDAEMGLMSTMVTITHNDNCPEMLAVIRRGPFATPTEDEMLECYLGIKPANSNRPDAEHYALEHVLSYQRRVKAVKDEFMPRHKRGPLGWIADWWDRTEAQVRAALHAHILVWFRRRDRSAYPGYNPIGTVQRDPNNPGWEPRQRAAWASSPAIQPYQEDDMYYDAEVARVTAEMVRPTAATLENGAPWGGFDIDLFDIAGLARAVQERLYVHKCTPRYCLQDRPTCRFFFPWPCQPQQQYDENVNRVALRRRLAMDDAWVVPHDLELAMFSPATINVLPFDPRHGADQARQYAGKYAGKGEKYFYLETERDGVKDFLKARTVGLCMAHNRLLNFHVVRSTRPVVFTPAAFVPTARTHSRRDVDHMKQNPGYPDPAFFLGRLQESILLFTATKFGNILLIPLPSSICRRRCEC